MTPTERAAQKMELEHGIAVETVEKIGRLLKAKNIDFVELSASADDLRSAASALYLNSEVLRVCSQQTIIS